MALGPIREPDRDPSLYDFRHLIDIGLEVKRATKTPRTRDGWTSASLGYCLRRQFYDRANVTPFIGEGEKYRTLFLGDLIHEGFDRVLVWAGLLIAPEVHLVDEELQVSGYIDAIWGGKIVPELTEDEADYKESWQNFLSTYRKELVSYYGDRFPITGTEFKSSKDYGAKKAYQEGPQFHHVMQLASYALMAERNPEQLPEIVQREGIDRWQLTIASKDDLAMPIFEISQRQVERVEQRIEELNQLWTEGKVPPCTCHTSSLGWEHRYCPYSDTPVGPKERRCCFDSMIEEAAQGWEAAHREDGEETVA